MSLPSRTRVLESGSSFPGWAGSGICLTQTTTFMVADSRRDPLSGANSRGKGVLAAVSGGSVSVPPAGGPGESGRAKVDEEPRMVDVDDVVRLVIPAEPGFLRLARLTAAAVASRMGFTFD